MFLTNNERRRTNAAVLRPPSNTAIILGEQFTVFDVCESAAVAPVPDQLPESQVHQLAHRPSARPGYRPGRPSALDSPPAPDRPSARPGYRPGHLAARCLPAPDSPPVLGLPRC